MKNKIDIDITIPTQTRYLALIGKIGEDMAHELESCPENRARLGYHINMVLTEALVNAIKHANKENPSKELHIRITASEKELMIRVYDQGQGFDLNMVPQTLNCEPLNEHGRGIFIIRSLMDSVEYKKDDGENVLVMRKSLCNH